MQNQNCRQPEERSITVSKEDKSIKGLRKIINTAIWTFLGVYIVLVTLLQIPVVQSFIGGIVADAIANKLNTKVTLSKVDLGLFNKIIIDDLSIEDQKGEPLLSSNRIAAKVDIISLLNSKVRISSAQIFGLKGNIYKENKDATTNLQFVIDALSSKEKKEHTPLDIKINSIIIRRSAVAYNQLDAPRKESFSPKHIGINNISAHIIINCIKDDSLNINIKRLALQEISGLNIKSIAMKLNYGNKNAVISDFALALPHSKLSIPEVRLVNISKSGIERGTVSANGSLRTDDLAFLLPGLNGCERIITIDSKANIHNKKLFLEKVAINSEHLFDILLNGSIEKSKEVNWDVDIKNLSANIPELARTLSAIKPSIKLPSVINELDNVVLKANSKGNENNFTSTADITTNLGKISCEATRKGAQAKGNIDIQDLRIGVLTGVKELGLLDLNNDFSFFIDNKNKIKDISSVCDITRLNYKSYTFNDIKVKVTNSADTYNAELNINDAFANINILADYTKALKKHKINLTANCNRLRPDAIGLTDKWHDDDISFCLNTSAEGTDLSHSSASATISDLRFIGNERDYTMNLLNITTENANKYHKFQASGDFGSLNIVGDFNPKDLPQSIGNIIAKHLPTMPGIHHTYNTHNNINITANIHNLEMLKHIMGINISAEDNSIVKAVLNDDTGYLDMSISAPELTFNNTKYENSFISVSTRNNKLALQGVSQTTNPKGNLSTYNLTANAENNNLSTKIHYFTDGKNTINCKLKANANFFANNDGIPVAVIKSDMSDITIGDKLWKLKPAVVTYEKNNLSIDNLALENENQSIFIHGKASKESNDSIVVGLKNINLGYILDQVHFHAVSFEGDASGKATIKSLFEKPVIKGDLTVEHFKFEKGNLGTLHAKALFDIKEGNIDIDAITQENDSCHTTINGYISPKNNAIDLAIKAHKTNIEFMNNFCYAFMNDIEGKATGDVRLWGKLVGGIYLTGEGHTDAALSVTSIGTRYTLKDAYVRFDEESINFPNDTIYDRDRHIGVVNGTIRHKHLGQMAYNIDIEANNLLCFDKQEFGEDDYYGTVYADGSCNIRGGKKDIIITVNATPRKGTMLTYNASSPEAVSTQNHITFHDAAEKNNLYNTADDEKRSIVQVVHEQPHEISSDLHLNFLVNCTPDAAIRILMDENTYDYITLYGNGVIKATYYDKGAFEMFGNYLVESGQYNLTIQNVIKRKFEFLSGGTISFGGNPMNAPLNLTASYTVVSVSLSDLNIGNNFNNNNIPVTCLMAITGTPGYPEINFNMDLPNANTEVKQMITSLINSEDEMNQQVLYLLAFGRFLDQDDMYSNSSLAGRTSLVMQSILSGTISQQLSSTLEQIIDNNNWNIGANISTGDEGFYNAEYEGLLSGRMMNNRLLINGQFGYRDNQNATSSFIGDFDLKYLLVPNGNIAVNVYNKTNDKYFTKNSLNTQGVGIVLKKEFGNIKQIFKRNKKEKEKKTSKIQKN